MRFIWLIFVGLVLAMLGILPRVGKKAAPEISTSVAVRQQQALSAESAQRAASPASLAPAKRQLESAPVAVRRDSVVRFARQQLGTNYCYAGTTPATGFDCSGFVQFVFQHFNVPVPHSTALLIDVGQPVSREQALPGDIVVFTGTAKTSTTPGHAGIVVEAGPAGPLRFIHSSSARRESGVKISQVEGSDYERRFMQVRRVLGVAQQASPAPAKAVTSTAQPAAAPAMPPMPPAHTTSRVRHHAAASAAHKKATAKKPVRKTSIARKKTVSKKVRRPASSTKPQR